MGNKPTPVTNPNAGVKAAYNGKTGVRKPIVAPVAQPLPPVVGVYGAPVGYVPTPATNGGLNGTTAPALAPVPAIAAPATTAPVARGAYYIAPPPGIQVAGNPTYVTMVALCNLATWVGSSVNKVVTLGGGNAGNKATPNPLFVVTTFGGNKYQPASAVPALCAMVNYVGPIAPYMYWYRNTAQGIIQQGKGMPAGITPPPGYKGK